MKLSFIIVYCVCVLVSPLYFTRQVKKYGMTALELIGIIFVTLIPIVNLGPAVTFLLELIFKIMDKLNAIQLAKPKSQRNQNKE